MNLLSNPSLYDKLISKVFDILFIIDSNGFILDTNKEYHFLNIEALFSAQDLKNILTLINKSIDEHSAIKNIDIEVLIDKSPVWHKCRIGYFDVNKNGKPLYFLSLCNIQKQKDREHQLISDKEHAEAQEKTKTSFLANMSHEIRTPMNSIIGFADLIKNATDEDEKIQYLDIIKSSGQYLLNIINDIIDISKIESGILNIKVQRVNINQLLNELCDIYQSDKRLDSKKVKITTQTPLKDSDSFIITDQTRLRQVLSNLIDNAVKFTAKGSITIGYEILDKENGEKLKRIRFFIKDTGQGIPKAEQDLVFHRFHQVREGDEIKGSGLGLAIVHALVEKLGGQIKVKSTLGVGSEFEFAIPLIKRDSDQNPNKNNEMEDVDKPILEGFHIMIAEDVSANYKLISAVLRGTKAKLTWAQNGKEAVEIILDGTDIDLILMDLRMPIMDGYTASRHIKTINPKIPILALTAFAGEGDMEKALDSGCDDYLTKPLSIPTLYKKLKVFLSV